MAKIVRDSKGLGEALKNSESEIIIEGDLKNKVVRIKAKGAVAWVIAIGAIGIAVAATLVAPITGGTSEVASLAAAPAAISVLGVSTATAAVGIAVAAGGIGALNDLRDYRIIENNDKRLVLRR
ncbi:hypothetical protein [Clostridium beijerinckii]|uniref:hypothetical protein n=1 Tax=Clostridium beijerinckii TaxID=1520 RepID=UPI00242B2A56|nr:hypothetical protein [Clostridium beijerinckii]MDG5853126.1 hypothetical protein [Clostridium beijerinckii]